MTLIASFVVEMAKSENPRHQAIKKMNQFLNVPYAPRIKPVQVPRDTIASVQTIPSYHSTLTVLQPIVNSVSRHARHKYTPLQHYQRIHLACMHLPESVIIKMIEKGTMTDMPKSIIPTMRRTACTCYICLQSKSTKLP